MRKDTIRWIVAFIILLAIVVIADIVFGRIHK